jgi:hypothetical protein
MDRNHMDRGIDLTQLWGVFFIRWRIIGAALGAAIAIAFITGGVFEDSEEIVVPSVPAIPEIPVPSAYTASAVYGVVPVGELTIPGSQLPPLTQALTQTYKFLLTTDSVTNSLVTNVGLETTSEYLPEETSISVVSGTPYLTITATMDSSADAIAITNSYADALEATETFSSINLGDLRFRLELVESAQTATAIMATVENVEPTTHNPQLPAVASNAGSRGLVYWLFGCLDCGMAGWPRYLAEAGVGQDRSGFCRQCGRTVWRRN